MHVFQNIVLTISRYAAYASAAILCYMVGHILLEIVLRTFFSTSTFMLDEMIGYGVAAMAFLALGYSFEFGAIIRVNLLLARFSDNGIARRVLELVSICITLFITGVAIRFFFKEVWRAYTRGYVSETLAQVPTWIPRGFLLLGLVLFWIQLLAYFLRIVSGEMPKSADRAANLGIE